MAQDQKPTKGRSTLKTLLGVTSAKTLAPVAAEPVAEGSVVPDSFGHMIASNGLLFDKPVAKNAEIEELRRQLGMSEEARAKACSERLTAMLSHDSTTRELELEREAHEAIRIELDDARVMVVAWSHIADRLRREVDGLKANNPQDPSAALANAEQTIADFRRITERLRNRLDAIAKYKSQAKDPEAVRSVEKAMAQRAIDQFVGSLASFCIALGLEPGALLEASKRPIDPDEHERVSTELRVQIGDSLYPPRPDENDESN